MPGASLFLQAVQDIRVGGRQSNAQYQYTLQADTLDDLYTWAPKILAALQQVPKLTRRQLRPAEQGPGDRPRDRPRHGRAARRHGQQIDNTLYDAFGQRQVSTIYNALNQYHVVMEVAPQFWQSPETLKDIYVSTAGGAVGGTQSTNAVAGTVTTPRPHHRAPRPSPPTRRAIAATNAHRHSPATAAPRPAPRSATAAETMVPLSAFSHFGPGNTPLAVNHQGLFVATTISFNLRAGQVAERRRRRRSTRR